MAAPEVPWLRIKLDKMYHGVQATVTCDDTTTDPSLDRGSFAAHLGACLDAWVADGRRGVWLTVPMGAADLVPEALLLGFECHHANSDEMMLTNWLPGLQGEPSTLPLYPHHQVGVGGVVVNANREILAIQEKRGITAGMKGFWKLPGGIVDPAEGVSSAACREVLEETGIHTTFHSIAAFRETHAGPWGTTDLYMLCILRVGAWACAVMSGRGWEWPGARGGVLLGVKEAGGMAAVVNAHHCIYAPQREKDIEREQKHGDRGIEASGSTNPTLRTDAHAHVHGGITHVTHIHMHNIESVTLPTLRARVHTPKHMCMVASHMLHTYTTHTHAQHRKRFHCPRSARAHTHTHLRRSATPGIF